MIDARQKVGQSRTNGGVLWRNEKAFDVSTDRDLFGQRTSLPSFEIIIKSLSRKLADRQRPWILQVLRSVDGKGTGGKTSSKKRKLRRPVYRPKLE